MKPFVILMVLMAFVSMAHAAVPVENTYSRIRCMGGNVCDSTNVTLSYYPMNATYRTGYINGTPEYSIPYSWSEMKFTLADNGNQTAICYNENNSAEAFFRVETFDNMQNITPWRKVELYNGGMGTCSPLEDAVYFYGRRSIYPIANWSCGQYKVMSNFTTQHVYYKEWEVTINAVEGDGCIPSESEQEGYVPEYNAFDIGYAAIDLVAGSLVGVAGVSFDLGTIIGVVVVLVLVGGVVLLAIAAIITLFKGIKGR